MGLTIDQLPKAFGEPLTNLFSGERPDGLSIVTNAVGSCVVRETTSSSGGPWEAGDWSMQVAEQSAADGSVRVYSAYFENPSPWSSGARGVVYSFTEEGVVSQWWEGDGARLTGRSTCPFIQLDKELLLNWAIRDMAASRSKAEDMLGPQDKPTMARLEKKFWQMRSHPRLIGAVLRQQLADEHPEWVQIGII